jgi:hypothetical protein
MDNNTENQEVNETGFSSQFNPLEENVVQRDYTRPNVQPVDVSPIEEPVFQPPSLEELDNSFRQQLGEDDPSGSADPRKVWGADTEPSSANPYMENLDKKEQKQASQAMVDAILDGYGSLKKWSNNLIKLDPKKIQKGIAEGEINPNMQIPIGGGRTVPLMKYVEIYNGEIADTISMSDEFKEKVSPVLLRVLMKRNIGMTDEQLLGYYVVSDLAVTGMQIFALRNQNNALINQIKESSMGVPSTPPPSNYASNPQPEPEPAPQPRQQPVQEPVQEQKEYFEPEEAAPRRNTKQSEFTQVEVLDDLQPEVTKTPKPRKSRIVKQSAMPQFGDVEILQHMEEVAKGGSPKRRRKK